MPPTRMPLALLVIDDSREDRVAYQRYLSVSDVFDCTFCEAESLSDGLRIWHEAKPTCVLLDYYLPDGEGKEFLNSLQGVGGFTQSFVVVMTGQGNEDVARDTLKRGAADYIPKRRIDGETLCRTVELAHERFALKCQLAEEHAEKDRVIAELQRALREVEQLSGLVPICAHCKSIRQDNGYWQEVEAYISNQSGTQFTHGICPDCLALHFSDFLPDGENGSESDAE